VHHLKLPNTLTVSFCNTNVVNHLVKLDNFDNSSLVTHNENNKYNNDPKLKSANVKNLLLAKKVLLSKCLSNFCNNFLVSF